MEVLLRTKCLQRLAVPGSVRALHKESSTATPQNFSSYESMKQNFKLDIPEYFNFAKDVLDHWTNMEKTGKKPSNPAFWWINGNGEEVRWSFEELGFLSRKLANVLTEACALRRGDGVILILPRIPEWWLANVACLRTGTVLIPGTTQLTQKDILYRLQSSKAKCIITTEALAPAVDAIASKCENLHAKLIVSQKSREGWGNLKEMMKHASDNHTCVKTKHNELMTIYFTSGTTGSPKMTAHTHCSFGLGLSINGRFWLDLTPSDVMWNTSDTGWAKSAWSSVFSPWIQGACVFAHYLPRFEPTSILQTLSKFPITVFCSAPTAYRMLVQHDMTRLQSSKAKCIITTEALAPAVDAIASKCENLHAKLIVSQKSREGWGNLKEMMKHASDNHTCVKTKHNELMTIYFTSGTTGSPKMTAHTHCSFGLGLSINGRFWLDLTPSDVMWNTSDTGWAKSAWSSVFSPWIQGACVFAHYLPRFEPTSILQTLSKFPITVFCSAPTAYRMLVQHDMTRSYKFKSLKHCLSAGEPMNPEVAEQWRKGTGLDIYEGYGQTETDNPSKTASTLRGNFYITGDKGYMDEDGYFWFVARSDDIILSSGYRIGPFEVESALIEHPSVAESAVVSSPDPIRGEVVKAFIVLNPDYKSLDPEQLKKEIQEHVQRTTAPYKYPRKKFRLPPPSSDFLADIIGLRKKPITGDLPKTMGGSLPSTSSKANINLQNDPVIQKYGSKKVGLTRCLLTKDEMKTFHFPLPGFPDCENFVPTKCNGFITDSSPLFGLDCEMCLTSKGRELTRISVVAEGGCCVMDELVKPDNKILDYLTRKDIQCPDRVGHDAIEDARITLELAQYFLKHGPKKVLEQARVEIPLFPFSIVQFSFEPFSPILTEEMNKRMRIKWAEMSTVYAGPFSKNCDLRALKRLFKSFGPVRSLTLVLETHQPHLCIQYEVLEAAQLAIETLDGILVEGSYIKVQRPVTELTLDCDTLVNELEQDSENRGTIYLSGVSETFKEHLLQQSNLFLGLEAVILPKDLKSGKQKKYCFLSKSMPLNAALGKEMRDGEKKRSGSGSDDDQPTWLLIIEGGLFALSEFKSIGSAQRALDILRSKDWKLKGRHALTPRHLHAWLRGIPSESQRPPGLRVLPPPSEQQALQVSSLLGDFPRDFEELRQEAEELNRSLLI
ncbi:Acyl-coenzyme A synthetase ACSM3, mitochondrial [Tupaia chinensis]|uniref:medium-chain acyl-CoA ligase n=2 Tax=Tupaia chinensis TaxID=246437 RepID=L9KIH0_TUPCH|nr:Acyl-coenzyme A synthetase ACSM3, mitochondrial [Tupaia chinensis]